MRIKLNIKWIDFLKGKTIVDVIGSNSSLELKFDDGSVLKLDDGIDQGHDGNWYKVIKAQIGNEAIWTN